MSGTAPIPPITGTVTLAVPVERAFEVFTGSVNSWWPHQRRRIRARSARFCGRRTQRSGNRKLCEKQV